MTRYVVVLLAVILGASIAHAEVDAKARAAIDDIRLGRDNVNAIKNLYVQDTVALPAGSIDSAAIAAGAVSGAKLAASVVSLYDTNDTTTVTGYSATSVGQLLLGGAGAGTGSIWRASATGTNSWVQVFKFGKL